MPKKLGLLEHVGKVVLFFLSRVVGKHGEKVEHDTVMEQLMQQSPWAFPGHALKALEQIRLCLLFDDLVPHVLSIRRQQVCVELVHLLYREFLLVFGGPFGKFGLLKFLFTVHTQFSVWCLSQSRVLLGLRRSLLGSLFTLASGGI